MPFKTYAVALSALNPSLRLWLHTNLNTRARIVTLDTYTSHKTRHIPLKTLPQHNNTLICANMCEMRIKLLNIYRSPRADRESPQQGGAREASLEGSSDLRCRFGAAEQRQRAAIGTPQRGRSILVSGRESARLGWADGARKRGAGIAVAYN